MIGTGGPGASALVTGLFPDTAAHPGHEADAAPPGPGAVPGLPHPSAAPAPRTRTQYPTVPPS